MPKIVSFLCDREIWYYILLLFPLTGHKTLIYVQITTTKCWRGDNSELLWKTMSINNWKLNPNSLIKFQLYINHTEWQATYTAIKAEIICNGCCSNVWQQGLVFKFKKIFPPAYYLPYIPSSSYILKATYTYDNAILAIHKNPA